MHPSILKYPDLPHRVAAVVLTVFMVLSTYGSGRLQDGRNPAHRAAQAIAEAGSQTLLIVASPTKPVSSSLDDTPNFKLVVGTQTRPVAREQRAVHNTHLLPRLSARLKSTQMTSTSL